MAFAPSLEIDVEELIDALGELSASQLPFALAITYTRAGLDARDEYRKALPGRFTLRNNWTEKGIRSQPLPREATALKRKYPHFEAEIGTIDAHMQRHESGETKRPGGETLSGWETVEGRIAIPTRAVKRNKRRLIGRGQRPRSVLKRKTVWIDEESWTIRQKPRKSKTNPAARLSVLYWLVQSAPAEARADFRDLVSKAFLKGFRERFPGELERAVLTAR